MAVQNFFGFLKLIDSARIELPNKQKIVQSCQLCSVCVFLWNWFGQGIEFKLEFEAIRFQIEFDLQSTTFRSSVDSKEAHSHLNGITASVVF